ncbi:hypothetical protein A0H81_12407 [Grifola frondosa]|uniref:Uncharacterized protein n=1 Tax=Grifola frondosa TaxID=5627 RepID=A0A1C7LSS0_GRIFR|nr:hypothetical protein A0H81_12407 [Grifola frondosa]
MGFCLLHLPGKDFNSVSIVYSAGNRVFFVFFRRPSDLKGIYRLPALYKSLEPSAGRLWQVNIGALSTSRRVSLHPCPQH